jgi:hypothetical protein
VTAGKIVKDKDWLMKVRKTYLRVVGWCHLSALLLDVPSFFGQIAERCLLAERDNAVRKASSTKQMNPLR